TVGGEISGYWATGRVNSAMLPPSTMTMDSTEAKIGRLMKKRENTVASTQSVGLCLAHLPRVCHWGVDRLRRPVGGVGAEARPVRQHRGDFGDGPGAAPATPADNPRQPPGQAEGQNADDREQGTADDSGPGGGEQRDLDEALDDVEEHGRQEDAEQ